MKTIQTWPDNNVRFVINSKGGGAKRPRLGNVFTIFSEVVRSNLE